VEVMIDIHTILVGIGGGNNKRMFTWKYYYT
jgi:hypothetical protein